MKTCKINLIFDSSKINSALFQNFEIECFQIVCTTVKLTLVSIDEKKKCIAVEKN